MTASWKRTTLGAICDKVGGVIKTGPFGAQLHESDYVDEGVPVVMPKDIIEGKVRVSTIARIGHEDVERLSQHKLKSGDIVYGRRGDIGRQALITRREQGWLCGTGCLRISLGDKVVDPTFLHYYLRDEKVIRDIANQAVGATMPNLNTTILRSIKIRHPDLPTQRKIAGILLAYDDLIENNLRRIKILEEMARSLYREWFVHFRFPGHESARFTDSELGKIPIGWKFTDLAAVCVRDKGIQTGPFGSQLHESDYSDEGVPVVMPKDLIGFRIRTDTIARIPEAMADKLIRHRMKLGDIVYGRRGDIGRRAFIMPHQVGWFCGTGCLRIRPVPDAVNGWYLFNFLGQDNVASLIAGRAQGVTMPNLNTGILSSVPVTLPPRSIQEQFAKLSFPFAQSREALQSQIQNLGLTRDLILPRLAFGGK
jgi:type I restriction enzyme, S subunit